MKYYTIKTAKVITFVYTTERRNMNYKVIGEPLPTVICDVAAGESLVTEGGAMSWMTPNMKMETNAGGLGKAFGRMFSGESIFMNHYTAQGAPGQIASLYSTGSTWTDRILLIIPWFDQSNRCRRETYDHSEARIPRKRVHS